MDGSKDPSTMITVVATDAAFECKTISTQDFIRFFQNTNVSTEILKVDVDEWESRDDYMITRQLLDMCMGLTVFNDFAERGFALVQAYTESTTDVEERMQFLLQTMEHHNSLHLERQELVNTSDCCSNAICLN